MVTTEKLKKLLRHRGCVPDEDGGPSGIEWWRTEEGTVKAFKHMVKDVLNRCVCCGEIDNGTSSACSAQHEDKNCNCFPDKAS